MASRGKKKKAWREEQRKKTNATEELIKQGYKQITNQSYGKLC